MEGELRLLRQALQDVKAIGDKGSFPNALATLAGQLQGEARQRHLRQALEAAIAIGDEWLRANVLAAVAGQLQGEPVIWKRMLKEAEQLGKDRRIKVLSVLANDWPASFAYSDFAQMLNTMGISNRIAWLVLVQTLAPSINELGGEAAVEDSVSAILDIACWWP
jgi:hypothetical protein